MELFIFLITLVLFIAICGVIELLISNRKLKSEMRVKDFCIQALREDIEGKKRLINFYKNEREINKDV